MQKILFPVDMSDSCTAAVPFVEAMAEKLQAEVTLLHVLEMPTGYLCDWYGYMTLVDTDAIRKARQAEFDGYMTNSFAGLNTKRVMLEGDAAQSITAYAHDSGYDLIMMPTHGYGIFRAMLLGSVTAKVLHDAACPVWTGVHVDEAPAAAAKCEQVMCAVDLTEKSVPAMQFASNVAQAFGAKLWLVHAVPGAETRPEKYFELDLENYLKEEARKKLMKLQEKAGIRAQICLGAGEVAHVVRHAVESHAGDLVVIGRGNATKTMGRLRTNVYSIIRQSPCPVISV